MIAAVAALRRGCTARRRGGGHPEITTAEERTAREHRLRRIDIDRLTHDWMAAANAVTRARSERVARRAIDIVEALALLILTLPLLSLTALLIRLESSGPVLYRQVRVGQAGAEFVMLKFRTMRVDAEAQGPVWATVQDRRVTWIGGFLRRSRIDELPQLMNVLRGEMSFIGPRPERPHFVAQLAEAMPRYRDRFCVKPGITGWAQVNYPYGASVEDARMKLSYDLYYVKHRSLLLDAHIRFATLRVVLWQVGAR